ncbi:DUF898 domain-containing protein [Flavobacterium sp. SM15]|uniref:YjgN family protein n=1 Tax=Flavobacterium sp. SM15 TaxID=2908005 RepID=UPI001EDA776F|nr:DUF898 domain-containing protein [Flavobacterium sp. SM15]MCG2612281.1 DUF898 domain-containing protein [Flavobacterium sp. SM15]
MEHNYSEQKNYKLNFQGKGTDFFGIIVVNWILTMLTLGLYYPWAKAKVLQYIYGATELNNDRFTFHGTGKEMFKGFIKAILIFAAMYGVLFLFIWLNMPFVGIFLFYVLIISIIPIAIHGSYRYRMSRTSWRGIRFGYRGDRNKFIKLFFKNIFLTIITLGIYGAWATVNIRTYVLSHIRMGSIKFKYKADGADFFLLNLKGYFLTLITLGIYSFWWQKEIFEFYVNNLYMEKDEQRIRMKSTASGGDFFALIVVNLLLLVFTLGLGYAWVAMRTFNFIAQNITLEGNIDLDLIAQTEEEFKDATGEDINDMLDIDFVM